MCCQEENRQGCQCGCHRHGGSCGCGRDQGPHFKRRFLSKAEKIADLEQYLESLQLETTAVEERIAALREE
jgi:hypothetical protein